MFLQEKKEMDDKVRLAHKWAKKNDIDVQIVRDAIRKKGKTSLSSPRVRFRSPRFGDRFI